MGDYFGSESLRLAASNLRVLEDQTLELASSIPRTIPSDIWDSSAASTFSESLNLLAIATQQASQSSVQVEHLLVVLADELDDVSAYIDGLLAQGYSAEDPVVAEALLIGQRLLADADGVLLSEARNLRKMDVPGYSTPKFSGDGSERVEVEDGIVVLRPSESAYAYKELVESLQHEVSAVTANVAESLQHEVSTVTANVDFLVEEAVVWATPAFQEAVRLATPAYKRFSQQAINWVEDASREGIKWMENDSLGGHLERFGDAGGTSTELLAGRLPYSEQRRVLRFVDNYIADSTDDVLFRGTVKNAPKFAKASEKFAGSILGVPFAVVSAIGETVQFHSEGHEWLESAAIGGGPAAVSWAGAALLGLLVPASAPVLVAIAGAITIGAGAIGLEKYLRFLAADIYTTNEGKGMGPFYLPIQSTRGTWNQEY